jgi:hypothetical protein
MSDLDGLHGVFPPSLRFNSKTGILGVSAFNSEIGERELQEIELGSKLAMFAMDMATRMRGYGLKKVGVYDMRLTPVGSPLPEWPGDGSEFKAAVGCWLWSPIFGEVRLETNATYLRGAIGGLWEECRKYQQAIEGLQPIIRFEDRNSVLNSAIGKRFWVPIVPIINWIERDKVPGWADRPPTVAPPAAVPLLLGPDKEPIKGASHHKAQRPAAKPGSPDDPANPSRK